MNATTLATQAVRTAREYLRVSKDRSGRSKSTAEQHTENTTEAEALGVTLGEPYTDNSRSASNYATSVREDFQRLIADLEANTFGADMLVLWESSRGSRDSEEWARLIKLCRTRGVVIHVTTHHRTYDPNNARDRRSLREDASDSEYESDKTSERSKRNHRSLAREGRPTGKTPLGYFRLYDPATRRLIAQIPDDDPRAVTERARLAEAADEVPAAPSAPMIRELFKRVASGDSYRSITLDFEARGFVNGKGKPYTQQHLRVLTRTHAYAGLRVHVAGRRSTDNTNMSHGPKAELHPGQWKPLVAPETFWKVQAHLDSPDRKTRQPGRAVHLLSMIAVCDVCTDVLIAGRPEPGRRQPTYVCRKNGHVRLSEAALDDYVTRQILDYLDPARLADVLAERSSRTAELQAVRDDVAEYEGRLDALAADITLSERVLTVRTEALEAALEDARRREREMSTPSELAGLLDAHKPIAAQWEVMPMAAKRSVARILCTPAYLGSLVIVPSPVRGWRGSEMKERVEFRS